MSNQFFLFITITHCILYLITFGLVCMTMCEYIYICTFILYQLIWTEYSMGCFSSSLDSQRFITLSHKSPDEKSRTEKQLQNHPSIELL